MHYLIQKSHRFLAIVSPNKHCNVSICDYSYIISIAGRKCFRVSYGYGKDFPPMHGLKLVPFHLAEIYSFLVKRKLALLKSNQPGITRAEATKKVAKPEGRMVRPCAPQRFVVHFLLSFCHA